MSTRSIGARDGGACLPKKKHKAGTGKLAPPPTDTTGSSRSIMTSHRQTFPPTPSQLRTTKGSPSPQISSGTVEESQSRSSNESILEASEWFFLAPHPASNIIKQVGVLPHLVLMHLQPHTR
ncbi:hypothetical protein BDP27DRAFT_1324163 [Rhodocollybia butyracea]|uniref:Uncharacterized protein n=1 Tax=Rhodocollybia butyracea TaxID=206335 RepID=A0A9P5U8R2_9AGAR|nr:hypothetical protein BDP27DRAFT_1324163 [Rhodocollybia butyracea]